MNLLGIGNDAKTRKGTKFNVLTGILYMAPSDESGVMNTCPKASKGCRLACLYTAGRGAMTPVRNARINKTVRFWNDRETFIDQLIEDIQSLIKKAIKLNMIPAVRLNGTSDIAWEKIIHNGKNIMEMFPNVTFYDYTKRFDRVVEFANKKFPTNYSLTFSRSENNQDEVNQAIKLGVNVAVVFDVVPKTYMNTIVIDGDEHDARFLDTKNSIVGLKAKGKAKKDLSGFVVNIHKK
jgi:hypothetical protein